MSLSLSISRSYVSLSLAPMSLSLSVSRFNVSLSLSLPPPEGSYWADSESPLFSLEATGYGLLALLEGGHLDEAVMPFNWLNSKRRRGGGYGSTQVSPAPTLGPSTLYMFRTTSCWVA